MDIIPKKNPRKMIQVGFSLETTIIYQSKKMNESLNHTKFDNIESTINKFMSFWISIILMNVYYYYFIDFVSKLLRLKMEEKAFFDEVKYLKQIVIIFKYI